MIQSFLIWLLGPDISQIIVFCIASWFVGNIVKKLMK